MHALCTYSVARRRGFSLLEVMVAVAILGLSLTVILSAQGGLAASNRSAANMGGAIHVGRCKMSELEEKLLKLGYPEIDDLQTDVSCCNDDSAPFRCDTRVEKVVLPNPPGTTASGDGGLSLSGSASPLPSGLAPLGSGGAPAIPGLPPGLVNPAGGAGLDLDAGLAGIGTSLQSQMGGASMNGMFNMIFSFVYPTLKIGMELSIRRLTVAVHWKEGFKARDFTLVEYVTNPARGGFAQGTGLDGGVPQIPGVPGGGGTQPGGGIVGAPGVPGVDRGPPAGGAATPIPRMY